MENQNIKNFDLKLRKTDTELLIEVENLLSGDHYSKKLNKDSAKSLSKDSYFDLDIIYTLLLRNSIQASNNKEKEQLQLTDDGKLVCTCQIIFGEIVTKTSGFIIDLDKIELDPLTKIDKTLEKLSKKVLKSEERINELAKVQEERFTAFEKLLLEKFKNLEILLLEKLNESRKKTITCRFDLNAEFASRFILSENNTIATSKEATYYFIPADKPLPSNSISKFSFKILKSSFVMVGILVEESLTRRDVHNDKFTVGYGENGHLYHLGTNKSIGTQYSSGDIISFLVDLQTGEVKIKKNSILVYTHFIEKHNLNKKYYPFIYTDSTVGCSVQFV